MHRIVRNYFLGVFGIIGFSAVCAACFWLSLGLMAQIEPLRPIAQAIRSFVAIIVVEMLSGQTFERNLAADVGFAILIIASIVGWVVINRILRESDDKK